MKSVVSRRITAMIIICIAGMTLIVALGAVLSGTSLEKESMEKIYKGVAAEAMRIEGWFGEKVAGITALAEDINFVEDKSKENLEELFKARVAADPDCFSVYIGFPDDSAVFNDGWVPDDGWLATKRPWYAGAVANKGSVYISDIYTDAETMEYVVSFSKAVTDKSGVLTGVGGRAVGRARGRGGPSGSGGGRCSPGRSGRCWTAPCCGCSGPRRRSRG
ncbi:MAG: PDC sensor domain-containing protein [Kiritimatiellaeota bacterium]|nr:PDC sensor domain-containing protein [Kiritimatiellota bacterium]